MKLINDSSNLLINKLFALIGIIIQTAKHGTQGSKSKAIIYALNSQSSDITKIIKQTIKECLKDISFTPVKEANLSNYENSLIDSLDDFL